VHAPSGLLFVLAPVARVHRSDLGLCLLHFGVHISASLLLLELKREAGSQRCALAGVLLVRSTLLEGAEAAIVERLVLNVAYDVGLRETNLHRPLLLLVLLNRAVHCRRLLLLVLHVQELGRSRKGIELLALSLLRNWLRMLLE